MYESRPSEDAWSPTVEAAHSGVRALISRTHSMLATLISVSPSSRPRDDSPSIPHRLGVFNEGIRV